MVFLSIAILSAVLYCACGSNTPSEEIEYELIFKQDALILKGDGKTIDSWKTEDIFAISGSYSAYNIVTIQGEADINAFFGELFSDGIKLTFTTEDMSEYAMPGGISMLGLCCICHNVLTFFNI